MTGKPPSQADVTIVQRSVDMPSSRAARRNKIRSDALEALTVGAGATETGTIVTNNSTRDWLLFHVTSTSTDSIAAEDLSGRILVTDDGGNLVYGAAGSIVDGFFSFAEGGIVRPGWSVDYSITNSSGAGADVYVYPHLSRSSVDDIGQDTGTTEPTPDDIIDQFERADVLAPYTYIDESGGTDNNWQEETGTVFEGTKALAWEGSQSGGDVLLSMPGDGLDGYPERGGDPFSVRVNGQPDGEQMYSAVLFGFDAALENGYMLRIPHGGNSDLWVYKRTDGSWSTVGQIGSIKGSADGEFHRFDIDFDRDISVSARRQDGSTVASGTATDSAPRHDNGGFGWRISSADNAGSKIIFDDAKFR